MHSPSTYATAWAQTQLDIPIFDTAYADHLTIDISGAPVMWDEMLGAVANTKPVSNLTLQVLPDAPRLKEALIRKHYEYKQGADA